jgi:hypothetical protein
MVAATQRKLQPATSALNAEKEPSIEPETLSHPTTMRKPERPSCRLLK